LRRVEVRPAVASTVAMVEPIEADLRPEPVDAQGGDKPHPDA
jgi:hypothetical protein